MNHASLVFLKCLAQESVSEEVSGKNSSANWSQTDRVSKSLGGNRSALHVGSP